MGGLATKMAQSMGLLPVFAQKPILCAISWLRKIYKSWFFDENEPFHFNKVFTEIGP